MGVTNFLGSLGGSGGVATGDWELAFSLLNLSTDPNDVSPVSTGVLYDRSFEYFAGVVVGGTTTAITAPALDTVQEVTQSSTSTLSIVRVAFTPDGAVQVTFGGQSTLAHVDAFAKLPLVSVTLARDSNSSVLVNATEFTKEFQNSGSGNAYFIIARRRVVA
jgi:hypothetical protein